MLADSHIANISATGITNTYGASQAPQALQACAGDPNSRDDS